MINLRLQRNRWNWIKAIPGLFLLIFGLHLHSQIPVGKANSPAQSSAQTPSNAPASSKVGVAQQPEAPVVSPVTGAYVLHPADAIQISVFNEPDLSVSVRLNADGTIMYPLIGRVDLSTLTVQQAQDLITRKLGDDYLVNPQVTITVIDYTKKYFTVLGQVAKPGPYEIPAEGKVTLLQAIGMAGGFTRIANPSQVIIKRVVGDKQYKIIKSDAKKLGREGVADEVQIQAGDTITVPESWF